ncbi:MAG TPA: hypothetical protein VHC22_06190 [Pirellulales bacterium]|nr:hypothetical protein [Pirellulales bacterium]
MFSSPIDPDLAARLNNVPLPADLFVRLRAVPLAHDDDLDAALADVPVPAGLERSLARPVRYRPRWAVPLRQAAAAVLVFAVSLSYVFAVVVFVAARFAERAWAGESPPVLATALDRTEPLLEQVSDDVDPPLIDIDALAADAGSAERIDVSPSSVAPDEPLMIDGGGTAAALAAGPQPAISGPLMAYDTWSIERPSIAVGGVGRSDHADRHGAFWRQTGLLPWLQVTAGPPIEVPLATDDTGYRLFRHELGAGRLPAPSAVRVEEFLAGIDYGLSDLPPLLLVAAPSPFGSIGIEGRGDNTRWLVMIAANVSEPQCGSSEPSADVTRGWRVSIRFDAERVRGYRVIGYGLSNDGDGRTDLDDDNEWSDQTFFAGNKAAIVLCEIELSGPYDRQADLASVSIVEANATLGSNPRPRRDVTAVLRAGMFAADFDTAPVVWQQAALVALAAEHFARSPFAAEVTLAEIAARARRIEPMVHERAGWREFIEMVTAAERIARLPRTFMGSL